MFSKKNNKKDSFWQCFFIKEADSTNDYVFQNAFKLKKRGCSVVVAEKQLKGRGRKGRFWLKTGDSLTFSLLICAVKGIEKSISLMPLYVANALCVAIEQTCNVKPFIKWPNDVLLEGKKIAGILLETFWLNNDLDFMVVGVGANVNLKESNIPEDLTEKMGFLSQFSEIAKKKDCKKLILEKFLEITAFYLQNLLDEEFRLSLFKEIKDRDFLFSKKIFVINEKKEGFAARAVDFCCDGGLLVQKEDGTYKVVYAEEISVKI